ncbi:NHL repeat-containing protein [Paenibacillus spongiae]|uniref:NHL repeat-containing protein n=1 Tax=Paenibacillus spongiae TaxID=2909671 RepID=A0ABY5S8J4_9BACL|nr:NHL repeat-containing protein [Paenibacillus spongiae]UVI30231.1 NHL repeat-containing protein [Paenibacillus spongiae]
MKKIILSIVSFVILASIAPVANASAPYESYNYNYYEEAVPMPAAYMPSKSISGQDLGVGHFRDPNDMYIAEDGFIYILDSGNNRIVVADRNWKLIRIIAEFQNEGKKDGFKNPEGIFVKGDRIYVADTENQRIVILSAEGELVRMLENPKSEVLPPNFKFYPRKITVDNADRVFVIARGVFEGIMQFDEKGKFIGYAGTIKIQSNPADLLWRRLATKAQREKMALFVPTEFSNVDIDRKGFVYATNIDPGSEMPVKRLNPAGEDVLKRYGYHPVRGDIQFLLRGAMGGPSKLTDIKVLDNGMFIVLDSLRNRVFCYDADGNLLYMFGSKGNQLGTFKSPAAVEGIGETIAVLDRGGARVVLFETTEFGHQVNQAVALHHNGEDEKAADAWREVLRLNANYDIAYIGIGKSLLMEKRSGEAIAYFEKGMNRKYYSVAYKQYRKEKMKEHIGTFLTGCVVLFLAWIAYKIVKTWRRRKGRRRNATF